MREYLGGRRARRLTLPVPNTVENRVRRNALAHFHESAVEVDD